MMSDRPSNQHTPPWSEEAEKGLLSSILQDAAFVLENCGEKIGAHMFFEPRHQMIFSALARMYEAHRAIDLITLGQFMEDDGQLEVIGGRIYLTTLHQFVMSGSNWAYYLDIIRRKFIRRTIIATCGELIRASHEENVDEHVLLDDAQAAITSLAMESDKREALRHVKEGVGETLERFDAAYHKRGQSAVNGLATGLVDLDRMTSGLKKQQLVIVGARPSQGKTALAMNLAANMAVENGVPVAVFSMEMSYEEVVDRLVCSVADVSLQRLRDGFLAKSDFDRLPEKSAKISGAPLWIDDSPGLTIAAFKARCRRAKKQLKVEAVVVDYLQLMKSPSKRAMDARWLEITEISAALKATAKELGLTVICCAQLNREAEGREFGKPKLSDLRESGSIEQDADIVLLLWRPERHLENYNQREKLAKQLKLSLGDGSKLYGRPDEMSPQDFAERDRQINEYAEMIVAKQRNGPVGEIRLRFESDITKFQSVTKKAWSNNPDERQWRPPGSSKSPLGFGSGPKGEDIA